MLEKAHAGPERTHVKAGCGLTELEFEFAGECGFLQGLQAALGTKPGLCLRNESPNNVTIPKLRPVIKNSAKPGPKAKPTLKKASS